MATHKLAILVEAVGAATAAKNLRGVDKAVSGIGAHAGKGIKTFGANLKGALTTPLGLIGITGGLFGLEHIISESVDKAQEFGSEVNRLNALTRLGAETTSAYASALEHFGIGADKALRLTGFLEKNVGNLTVRNAKAADVIAAWEKKHGKAMTSLQRGNVLYPKAAKFAKDYGLRILDTNGHIKDANQLLLTSADFFNNKSIPAQTKAAALAKLYGRSWQDLIPILSAGRQGISDAEEEAKRLGLTLTQDNLDALKKNKAATREWNTALGGLELQIGLKLLPRMTDLANAASSFVSEHGNDIVKFFEDAANFAGQMGAAIHDDVLPVFQGIASVWAGIPADLKKLLIAGFAVNKLSGGALTGIVGELSKGLIKGVLGMTAGVVNINAGVVNGGGGLPGGGGAAGAAEDLATKGGLLALIGTAGVVAAAAAGSVYAFSQLHHGADAGPGTFTPTVGSAFAPPKAGAGPFANVNWAKVGAEMGVGIVTKINPSTGFTTQTPKPTPVTGALTGGAPGRGNNPIGKDLQNLQHGAVTAIDTSRDSIVTATNDSKSAVVGGVTLSGRDLHNGVSLAGAQVSNSTARGASTVTTQSIGNTSRIVGAVQAARSIITNQVFVNVSGNSVTSVHTKQSRTGGGGASAQDDDWSGHGK